MRDSRLLGAKPHIFRGLEKRGFMELDTFVLSRIQFAVNSTFHILLPTVTIGLGWFLLFLRVRYTQTRDMYWEQAYNFLVKVYALTFALGVVSGITMSFQSGTNWPGFLERTGNIAGPLGSSSSRIWPTAVIKSQKIGSGLGHFKNLLCDRKTTR